MTSKLDKDRRAVAEILAMIAESGIAGRSIGPDAVSERLGDAALDGNSYMAIMKWLEDEGIIRFAGKPTLAGDFFRVQLSSSGLKILELTSPVDEGETVEATLATKDSPEARTKIGEFIGSVLGSGLSAFIKTGSGA